jgi:hypothetical protein
MNRMDSQFDALRRKKIGGAMLVCTLAAIAVTFTVEGKWVFYACVAFLVAVAFVVPLVFGRRKE